MLTNEEINKIEKRCLAASDVDQASFGQLADQAFKQDIPELIADLRCRNRQQRTLDAALLLLRMAVDKE